jgi:hypothetical protein
MKSIVVLLACVILAGVTGCVSSSKISHEASVGQQLEDLDKSYKDGIITQKEYERLKKALIKKND